MSVWWCKTCSKLYAPEGGPCPTCGTSLEYATFHPIRDAYESGQFVVTINKGPNDEEVISASGQDNSILP